MKLGAFSISLAVSDIKKSFQFYQALGFEVFGGDINQKWLILQNDTTVIGLFEGMFEQNIMTFNPGWDSNAKPVDPFDDVRKIEQTLLKEGIALTRKTEKPDGPEHIVLTDPDGNVIMLDQHR